MLSGQVTSQGLLEMVLRGGAFMCSLPLRALGRLRQSDLESEASLIYIGSSRPVLCSETQPPKKFCVKKKNNSYSYSWQDIPVILALGQLRWGNSQSQGNLAT